MNDHHNPQQAPSSTSATGSGVSTPGSFELIEEVRRLSIGSNVSSFSLVPSASNPESIISFDSDGTSAGGIVVLEERPKTPDCSSFWNRFQGFSPCPTATFRHEFNRLAKQQGWRGKTKQRLHVEALTAEVNFHGGGRNLNKLEQGQELCALLDIRAVPSSIKKCKKELQKVFVSLYNVIDHLRNPNISIVKYKSYNALSRHVRKGNWFPRECAKQDPFLRVLLKQL